jgi:hypothetical protein
MRAPSTLEAMRREQLLHDNAEQLHACLETVLGVLILTKRRMVNRNISVNALGSAITYAEHTLSRAEGRNPLK